jgi:predicted amidohydrolase
MLENCFYVGGSDDGVIDCAGLTVGAAVCWELMRSQTACRLRGRVDLLVSGSAWWSVPEWPPRAVTRRSEARNAANAAKAVPAMARAVGASMIHASHCGPIESPLPGLPVPYRGHYDAATIVCDGVGRILGRRAASEGAGIVLADLAPGRTPPGRGPEPLLAPPPGSDPRRGVELPAGARAALVSPPRVRPAGGRGRAREPDRPGRRGGARPSLTRVAPAGPRAAPECPGPR